MSRDKPKKVGCSRVIVRKEKRRKVEVVNEALSGRLSVSSDSVSVESPRRVDVSDRGDVRGTKLPRGTFRSAATPCRAQSRFMNAEINSERYMGNLESCCKLVRK